jgi:hypothetical protein
VKLGKIRQVEAVTGYDRETIKRLRLGFFDKAGNRVEPELIEGLHYFRQNSRLILYDLDLIVDFFINRHDPVAHQRAIDSRLAAQLGNESAKRGRKLRTASNGSPAAA